MPPVPPDASAFTPSPPAITRPDPSVPRAAAAVPDAGPVSGVPVTHAPRGYTPTVAQHPAPFPSMGTSGSGVSLPMNGPSPRVMTLAGVGIAFAGIAIGALVAWRAMRHPAPLALPIVPVPETNVALIETPHQIGADAGFAPSDTTPRRGRRGTTTTTRGTTPTTAGTTAANDPSTASDPPDAGASDGVPGGSHATPSHAGTTHGTATAHGGTAVAQNTPAGAGAADNGADDTTQPHGPTVGGYVQGEHTDATGTMDPQAFSFVYRFHRSQITSCHSQVTRNGAVAGSMRVRVRLATDGSVHTTRVLEDTTHSTELETCVQNAVHSWRYPQPEGGEVEFDYNFAFGT